MRRVLTGCCVLLQDLSTDTAVITIAQAVIPDNEKFIVIKSNTGAELMTVCYPDGYALLIRESSVC